MIRHWHPRDWPVRLKLFAGYALPMLIVIGISALVVHTLMRNSIERSLRSRLNNNTTMLLEMVEHSAEMSIHNHLRAIAEKNREIVQHYYQKSLRGQISEARAKEISAEILASQTIGETGYIYVLGTDGVLKVHPSLSGLDMADTELARHQKKRLEGYHEYEWKNPGDAKKRKKALYMAYFEPWNWIISASSYREEFNKILDLEEIRESVLALNAGRLGYSFIINQGGDFVIHPYISGSLENLENEEEARVIIERLLEEKNGSFSYRWRNPGELRDHRKLVFFTNIASLDWVVASTTYLEEVYAPLRTLSRLIGTLLLLATGVIFLVSWALSRRIVSPMTSLIQGFNRAREGDLTIRLPLRRRDELGLLAAQFNELMEQMERTSRSLRKENEERRQIAERLSESEGKYRELVESANEAIFILQDGHFRLANPRAQELFGRDSEELQGAAFAELVLPRDIELVLGSIRRTLEQVAEGGQDCTVRLASGDGEQRWVHLHFARISMGGRPAVLAFALDVTEQLLIRRQHASSEARYRALFEHSTDAIFLMQGDRLNSPNPKAASLFGCEVKELEGAHPAEFSPETQPGGRLSSELAAERIEAAYGGEPQHFAWVHQRKDGTLFDAEVNLVRVILEQQPCLFATVRDVSVRVRAVNALRESEQRFRTIFHTTPDAIAILRLRDGLYVDVNEGFTRISGMPRQQVIGQRMAEAPLTIAPARRRVLLHDLLKEGQIRNREVSIRLGEGLERTGLISANLFRLDGEQHVLAVTRDIEEIKQAARERERLAEQLVQSQKMESIGRLAGGVAHDFNNLLTAITGTVQVMNLKGKSEGIEQDLEVIENSTQRAAELTRQLLTFGKRSTVQPTSIQLNDLLRQMQSMLDRIIGEDVRYLVTSADELPLIRADRSQLEQIIVNLAVNAREAMPEGGELRFSTSVVELDEESGARVVGATAGRWVKLTVTDTGCGMEPEVAENVFEPFFTTKQEGTGLGLATVYGIVRQAGGVITLESKPGEGTEFTILLPAASGERAAMDQIEDGRQEYRGGETILLVENDTLVRVTTTRALTECGYRVLDAPSGEEAAGIYRASASVPDIVIADVVMPGISGFQLADELRGLGYEGPLLFISGYFDAERYGEELKRHEGLFFAKPFHPLDLARRIRTILDRRAIA